MSSQSESGCARLAAEQTGCWHCGELLPPRGAIDVEIAGEARSVCSEACRSAARRIDDLGLASYYRYRTRPAQKPKPDDDSRRIWQRPQMARHAIRDLGGGQRATMLLIDGVHCAACVSVIERALGAEPGVVGVQVVNAAARCARELAGRTHHAARYSRSAFAHRLSSTATRRGSPRRRAAARIPRRFEAASRRRLRRHAGHDVCGGSLFWRNRVAR